MRAAIWTAALAAALATGAARADVVIAKQATKHMNCEAGVCSPTAARAVLNTTDLAKMLASGDVKVATSSRATNIIVKDVLDWATTSRLTLDANQSVEIDKPVVVTGTGALTITTNDGGTGGDLIFNGKGTVTFWDFSSSIVINGNSYTLVGDIAALASDITNNPSGFYALANDHDASVDGTYSTAPITTDFHGTFEGLGHTIANLKIVSTEPYVGLFRQVFGALRDVGLKNAVIEGDPGTQIAGSLLAVSRQAAITGCYSSGSIVTSDTSIAGGLVGESNFTVDGSITRSHAAVSVTVPDDSSAGGLVGYSGFNITRSYATGPVRAGSNSFSGGLIGIGDGSISESYATGNVQAGGESYAGSLVGVASRIYDSYATGSVKAGLSAFVGGLGGKATGGEVKFTYSTGLVKGGNKITSGGFLGTNVGAVDSDYWNIDTSSKGRRHACGDGCPGQAIKGLTTEELQSGLPEGFDHEIWRENPNINGGLPYLINNPPQ